MGRERRFKSTVQPTCACGCGGLVPPCKDRPGYYGGHFVHGHHSRGLKRRPETVERIRQANLGRKVNDEQRENMRAARHSSGLSQIEHSFATEMKSDGWSVLKDGWPDFLLERNGVFKFVELKRRRENGCHDKLTPRQQKMHEALRRAGFQIEVIHRGR